MKNKKILAMAVLVAAALTGGSLAAFATETAVPDMGAVESEAETAVPDTEAVESETEAMVPDTEAVEPDAEVVLSDTEAVKFETEAAVPDTEAVEPDAEEVPSDAEAVEPDAETDDAEYSYHAGQQSSTARNDAYEALPEGGAKEDAEEFYETYDIGGGAWTDGAYDESLKSGYGYAAGQQRAAQYAQDGDDDEEYKSGYSYSVGRQSYIENYPNYAK